jgi:hypothetical protein
VAGGAEHMRELMISIDSKKVETRLLKNILGVT